MNSAELLALMRDGATVISTLEVGNRVQYPKRVYDIKYGDGDTRRIQGSCLAPLISKNLVVSEQWSFTTIIYRCADEDGDV